MLEGDKDTEGNMNDATRVLSPWVASLCDS